MRSKFPCITLSKYKAITKFAKKVGEMIAEGKNWGDIERSIEKLRRLDFKEFVKATF